ncbi:hypothetical protein P3T23_008061 [Paraburkholderia sp. GAS448]
MSTYTKAFVGELIDFAHELSEPLKPVARCIMGMLGLGSQPHLAD